MIKTVDIKDKIISDFGPNADKATKILEAALAKYEYINHDRIIRCVIFLAEKTLDGLSRSINYAVTDPRDVMLWAEYINLKDGETPKRIRDFNKTFDNCDNL